MWTVGDMLPRVARFAGGPGVSIETPEGRETALELYNEITEELLGDDAWDGATAEAEFSICDDCFTLPSHMESVRACNIGAQGRPIRPGGWRYLEQGPGLAEGWGLDGIADMGDHFAVSRDLPRPMQLMIYSDKPESKTAHAIIQGTTLEGMEIARGEFAGLQREPGERIQIIGAGFEPYNGYQASPLLTRATFDRRPSMVTKSKTTGHVFLMGYDAATVQPVWLATYRPNETRPSYRRYSVNHHWYKCSASSSTPVSMFARVDLRFVPAIHEDERAIIQFRPAFEIYAKALAARRSGAFDDYQKYRNSTLAKLKRLREKKIETQTHLLNISPCRTGASIATAPRRGWRYGGGWR